MLFQVAVYSYHYMYMPRKVFESCAIAISLSIFAKKSVRKLRNTHITMCECQEKCSKVAEFMSRKVVLKLQNTHITTCSCQEKCLKVSDYAYNYVFMSSKVFSKFRNTHITTCSCQGKLFESWGIRILLRVRAKERCFESCGIRIYDYVLMPRKFVSKLQNSHITTF